MVITSSVEEKPQPSNRMVANLSTESWIGNPDQSRYQSHLLRKPSRKAGWDVCIGSLCWDASVWMRTALCCELTLMMALLLGMLEQNSELRVLY
ncbi:hypothetical protein MHYP_G00288330 [Metynnis hypsauchen]